MHWHFSLNNITIHWSHNSNCLLFSISKRILIFCLFMKVDSMSSKQCGILCKHLCHKQIYEAAEKISHFKRDTHSRWHFRLICAGNVMISYIFILVANMVLDWITSDGLICTCFTTALDRCVHLWFHLPRLDIDHVTHIIQHLGDIHDIPVQTIQANILYTNYIRRCLLYI